MAPAYLFFSNMADCVLLNVLGAIISVYSLHIELRKEKDPNYRAYCDFNEHMSCSKVLTSKFSVGFGFMHLLFGKNHVLNQRNCNVGIVLYVINIFCCVFLPQSAASFFMFYAALVSVLGCVYLATVLFLVLKDFCLVCVTIYLVNGCLLYLSHSMYTHTKV